MPVFLHIAWSNTMESNKTTNNAARELIGVKVGSDILTNQSCIDWLALDRSSARQIGAQVVAQRQQGKDVTIISSGGRVGGYDYSHEEVTHEARRDVVEKQRMICLGQVALMHMWQEALAPCLAAQLLFTKQELETNEGIEASRVARRLIECGDIPVANENALLSHKEITFGDNDTLAAHYMSLLHKSGSFVCSRLVILSNIDGVYEDVNDKSSILSVIDDIDAYEHVACSSTSTNGSGGMASKFAAAKIATENGVDVYIANGRTAHAVQRAIDGEIGTRFPAKH